MTLCLKALIYIITYFIGGHNEWSWPNNKYSHTDIYVCLINSLGGKHSDSKMILKVGGGKSDVRGTTAE